MPRVGAKWSTFALGHERKELLPLPCGDFSKVPDPCGANEEFLHEIIR